MSDGKPCLTTRDFALIDQDQSDNVITAYLLVTATGTTAQNTTANRAQLTANGEAFTEITNGSDNRLLDIMNGLMGCVSYKVPDIGDANIHKPAQALNELHAALRQQRPVALVPKGDPMVRTKNEVNPLDTTNTFANLEKLNRYRLNVNQPPAANLGEASTLYYCFYMATIQPQRLLSSKASLVLGASLDAAAANNLFSFLAFRFVGSYNNLKCMDLLGAPPPMKLVMTGTVVTDATLLDVPPTPAQIAAEAVNVDTFKATTATGGTAFAGLASAATLRTSIVVGMAGGIAAVLTLPCLCLCQMFRNDVKLVCSPLNSLLVAVVVLLTLAAVGGLVYSDTLQKV